MNYRTTPTTVEEVEAIEGIIIFDRDVSKEIVASTVSSCRVLPVNEVDYKPDSNTFFFPYELGNREVGKTSIIVSESILNHYWTWISGLKGGFNHD